LATCSWKSEKVGSSSIVHLLDGAWQPNEIILAEDGVGEGFAEEFATGLQALGDFVSKLLVQWPGGCDRGLALIA
jgi:hypothetical protein